MRGVLEKERTWSFEAGWKRDTGLARAFRLEYDRLVESLKQRDAARDGLTEADATVSEREAVRRAADQVLDLAAQEEAIVGGRRREEGKSR